MARLALERVSLTTSPAALLRVAGRAQPSFHIVGGTFRRPPSAMSSRYAGKRNALLTSAESDEFR